MNIEEILLAKAIEDAAAIPTMGEATTIGGLIGALTMGEPINQAKALGKSMKKGKGTAFKPGRRAGQALIGSLLGGSLGAGAREMAIQGSPEAAILAKIQAGTATAGDVYTLEKLLGSTYAEMGLR